MSVPVNPLADYVVAVPEEVKTKTASGLYLPEKATEKPKTATVVAVGPGRVGDDNERIPVGVAVGDRIVYKSYGPTEVKVDGSEYLLIKEEDILATVK